MKLNNSEFPIHASSTNQKEKQKKSIYTHCFSQSLNNEQTLELMVLSHLDNEQTLNSLTESSFDFQTQSQWPLSVKGLI